MEIPTIVIPPIQKLETVEIPLPTADVPFYKPLVLPPSDLKEPEGTEGHKGSLRAKGNSSQPLLTLPSPSESAR